MPNLNDAELKDRKEYELRLKINTAIPARVAAVAADTVDIELGILRSFGGEIQPPLLVTMCPVVYPGAGSFSMTYPIRVGDTGLAVFSQRDVDRWLEGEVTTPNTLRLHDYTDAVFIPGLRQDQKPIPQTDTIIEAGGTKITLTENGTALIETPAGNSVTLADDGSVTATSAAGATVTLDPAGGVTVQAVAPVSVTAPVVDVTAAGAVNVTGAGAVAVTAGGALSLTSGGALSIASPGGALALGGAPGAPGLKMGSGGDDLLQILKDMAGILSGSAVAGAGPVSTNAAVAGIKARLETL